MRLWPVSLLILSISSLSAQEPSKPASGSLTIEDVVSLSKAGISEEVIVIKVKVNAKPFDLNADEIVELKKSGVSETVIKYLTNPALPYSAPAPPVPPAAALAGPAPPAAPGAPVPPPVPPKPPSDPLVLKVPPEPGIYYLAEQDQFTALALKTVVPYKQPGKAIPFFKGHIVGSVVGPKAETRVAANSSVFYVRLGEKASIDDLTLLALEKSGNRRDLDFGTKPGKPAFPVNSVKEVESKQVYTGVYRFTVPMIKKGEYLFFILGSGDEKKGQLGKGYDLGVN